MRISISIHLCSIAIHSLATRFQHPTYKHPTISHTTPRRNTILKEHAGSRIDPKNQHKTHNNRSITPPPFFFLLLPLRLYHSCRESTDKGRLSHDLQLYTNTQSKPLVLLPMRGLLRASQRGEHADPKVDTHVKAWHNLSLRLIPFVQSSVPSSIPNDLHSCYCLY